jgi:ubiquinone/menaquinone biosynthesis C-methylase UbiE
MSLEKRHLWAKQYLDRHYPNFEDAETIFEKMVKEMLRPEMVLLDAGCGKGEFLDKLGPATGRAVGIDLSKESVKKAGHNAALALGTLEALPFRDETFDLITCRWVVEHLEDPGRSLSELHRVLKTGGRIVLLTSNARSYAALLSRLMPLEMKRRLLNKLGRGESDTFPTYYRCNSVSKIRELASENQFSEEGLTLVGSPFYFFFSKSFFRLAVAYEKLTDFKMLNASKIHIIASFIKQ